MQEVSDRLNVEVNPCYVWLGISIENQKMADKHIPTFLNSEFSAHCSVNFISAEPHLGPIELDDFITYFNWVVVGGETGPDHRPMKIEWARSLRDQAISWGIPFYFKQYAGPHPAKEPPELDGKVWKELPQ